jgi:hypothetical protein
MTLSEYRKRLLHIPFVIDLPEPMRERVAMFLLWIGQPAQFSVGDALFIQDDEDENTGCILLQGEVEILRAGRGVVRAQAPELLGEMQQFEPTAQRTATVRVSETAQTLLFSWHDFVAYAAVVLNCDEQLVLREVIRASAVRRHV